MTDGRASSCPLCSRPMERERRVCWPCWFKLKHKPFSAPLKSDYRDNRSDLAGVARLGDMTGGDLFAL